MNLLIMIQGIMLPNHIKEQDQNLFEENLGADLNSVMVAMKGGQSKKC